MMAVNGQQYPKLQVAAVVVTVINAVVNSAQGLIQASKVVLHAILKIEISRDPLSLDLKYAKENFFMIND